MCSNVCGHVINVRFEDSAKIQKPKYLEKENIFSSIEKKLVIWLWLHVTKNRFQVEVTFSD